MPHDQNFRTLLRASERLSKPARAGVEADEAAAEGGERLVAAGPALVAPAAALVEPGQEPRDDPAVAVQAVAAFAAGAGDGDPDGARGPGRAAAGVVVARVDVAPVRRLAAPAVGLADGRDGVKQRLLYPGLLTSPEPSPTGHAGPAAQLLRYLLRRIAGRTGAIRHVASTPLGLGASVGSGATSAHHVSLTRNLTHGTNLPCPFRIVKDTLGAHRR